MIDIKARDIKALEDENDRLRKVLQEILEDPSHKVFLRIKDLERINYQLTALMSLTRQLSEQNHILEHSVVGNNMAYLRPPSTL